MQTRGTAAAGATLYKNWDTIKQYAGQTHNYIVDCLMRLYAGDYGTIGQEDTDANNAELEAGEGRIVAHYEQKHKLTEDIFIIATFSKSMPDLMQTIQ